MAVNYTSALSCHPSTNQLPFYTSPQQPSPTDSAIPTPQNVSPTSPRMDTCLKYQLPNQVRQLRPPKSPLYVPAALRPTERPGRQAPITPPKSLRGSLDSLEEAGFEVLELHDPFTERPDDGNGKSRWWLILARKPARILKEAH